MSTKGKSRRKKFKKIEDSVDKATRNGRDSAIPEPKIKPTNGFNYFSVYNWLDATDAFLKVIILPIIPKTLVNFQSPFMN